MVNITRYERRNLRAPECEGLRSQPAPTPEAAALLSEITLLTPPFFLPVALMVRVSPDAIALGGVIAAQATPSVILPLAALTVAAERWPWAVPYLGLPFQYERLVMPLRIVSELRDRMVVGGPLPGDRLACAAALRAAVQRRGTPSAEQLAAWVATRVNEPMLEPVLFAQFRIGLEGTAAQAEASNSTYSRFFARLGSLTARDWRAIARLCVHVSAGAHETLPASSRIAVRTAVEYARRYLGITYSELSSRIGWEWILECALRRAGYV
jgi:hypothetical protein